MFHPSQLETRFGGTAESPTNFWPPFIGTEFIPEHDPDADDRNVITPEHYEQIIAENHELYVHPDRMKPERCESMYKNYGMHFKLSEPETLDLNNDAALVEEEQAAAPDA